jgi:RNA polymerase sigma-70 factor (ECF subfamily)
MDPEAELALVGRLREGDAAAFDLVHEEFHARLYSFLARLARSRDVAEDLVEETWVRLVTHAGRLRPCSSATRGSRPPKPPQCAA